MLVTHMAEPSPHGRILLFVNMAHAFDHFVLLIYPTAVIAIAAASGASYASMIGLSTGCFLAFGLVSLPVGWMADRVGRRALMAAFFLGCGASCLGIATANGPIAFAVWLTILGIFGAIYHPVGSALLVSHAERLGRSLGRNGVWGNLGAASAAGVTAFLAASFGWRAAFIVPGAVGLVLGVAFLLAVPREAPGAVRPEQSRPTAARPNNVILLGLVFLVALAAGGMTFNIVTIAIPKVIDERLGLPLPLTLVGSLATGIFILGALTQLVIGRLVDRVDLPRLFACLSVLQPLGLALAALTEGVPMLLGLTFTLAAIYGQVVVNDAIIAHYVPSELRARAFGIRYFIGFSVSGLAVPLIALLHSHGGFGTVLGGTALVAAAIFLSAVTFYVLIRAGKPLQRPVAAP